MRERAAPLVLASLAIVHFNRAAGRCPHTVPAFTEMVCLVIIRLSSAARKRARLAMSSGEMRSGRSWT